MSLDDPRFLIRLLLELEDELNKWSHAANVLREDATRDQLSVANLVEVERRDDNIAINRFESDQYTTQKTHEDLADLRQRCEEARESTLMTLKAAQNVLERARNELQKWQNELALAEAWLIQAK